MKHREKLFWLVAWAVLAALAFCVEWAQDQVNVKLRNEKDDT